MMRLLIALLCVLFWASGAEAQQLQVVTNCGDASLSTGMSPGTVDKTGRACGSNSTTGAAVTGFGTLAATNASALLSTLTIGPSSTAWPTSPAQVYVKNSEASAGNLYVCPLGGTCTAATGLILGAGASWGFYKPSTSLTVISDSTATAVVQW